MDQAKVEMPGYVLLRHEDVRTGGIPDLSVTGVGRTSWWEFKHGTPSFETNGLQEVTCLRLAAAGICFYIIFEENLSVKRTLIVHPRYIKELKPHAWTTGFDNRFIIEFIKGIHRVPGT